jgi:hypothetical protein
MEMVSEELPDLLRRGLVDGAAVDGVRLRDLAQAVGALDAELGVRRVAAEGRRLRDDDAVRAQLRAPRTLLALKVTAWTCRRTTASPPG